MSLQRDVADWAESCIGPEKCSDKKERAFRFLEEALELVQACGVTPQEIDTLVDYTFSRPVGEVQQEVAGVGVCLFLLAEAYGFDVNSQVEVELARVTELETFLRIKRKAETAPDGPLPADTGWSWWAGPTEEIYTSQEETREGAIQALEGEGGYICEAKVGNIRLARHLDLEYAVERADENIERGEHDDDVIFVLDQVQLESLKAAIDKWQTREGITFKSWLFESQRNEEFISADE